jgi:D-tyrosyl-tRNA(Tyr) deacylase
VFRTDDTAEDVDLISQKMYVAEYHRYLRPLYRNFRSLNLKAFADPQTNALWKASVVDVSAEVLCVSQFTLYAKIVKNKPDFHTAMAWLNLILLCQIGLTVCLGSGVV